ncbi:MAG: hypothetical protein CL609_23430 [Anaerolineaceae bacterium]|nr:hypothetical protein [Anaerolineaceae bacterium]
MKIVHRPYRLEGDDFKNLCQLVVDDYRCHQENFTWLLGRIVDWKYGLWQEEKYFPNFFPQNAHLWENPFGGLIGFVISENGNSQFSVIVKPQYKAIIPEMVGWIVDHWLDREEKLETILTESDVELRQAVEKFGFENKGLAEVTYQYDLSTFDFSVLKQISGYHIEDMKSNEDLAGKAALQLNAFQNRNEVKTIDLLTRKYVHESTIYAPEFDFSVVTPDGLHVAGCEAFIDYENGIAEVERVCTHKDYRRQGLSRLVILTCFKRLYDHGIKTAYISGWNEATYRLYGGIEHISETKRYRYERKK